MAACRGVAPVRAIAIALAAAATLAFSATAWAQHVVISQVYGGGGNSGAQYKNDFIELFNPTSATVSLDGWSVQYLAASGGGANTNYVWSMSPLSGSILPGHYYLVQEAPGAGGTVNLPTPDAIDASYHNATSPIGIAMAAGSGKVALVASATILVGNCPNLPVVDLVGYGTATCYEGPGPTGTVLTNANSASRKGLGCTDTDNNAADFEAPAAANPRNSASPAHYCGTPTNPTGVGVATPNIVAPGNSTFLTVTVTPGTLPTSTGITVAADLGPIGGSASQPLFDDGSNGDVTAGDNVFSFLANLGPGTPVGAKSLLATIADAQGRSSTETIELQAIYPTNPAPQPVPYAQDFSGLPWSDTSYPTGWQGWEISTASGASYAYGGPNLDLAMLGNRDASSSAISAYNYNSALGFLTGSGRVLALALAVNTSGHSNLSLKYRIGVLRNPYDGVNNTCLGEAEVQYRVGTSGPWFDVAGTQYQSTPVLQVGATLTWQNPQSFSVLLPAACANQPVVQLRWTSRDVTPPGVAGRPSFALDDVAVQDACTAPVPDVANLPTARGECSVSLTAPTATSICAGTITGTTADSTTYTVVGTHTVHWVYDDGHGGVASQDQAVEVVDTTPPTLQCAPVTAVVDAGQCYATVTLAPRAQDNCAIRSVVCTPASGSRFPIGTTRVHCVAADFGGNQAAGDFDVTVSNPAPVVAITGPASGALYAVGTPVTFSGSFTDNAGDTHTATWHLDAHSIDVPADNAGGAVGTTYTFTTPGVYLVSLTVTDQCGGTSTATTVGGLEAMVVVFDPSAGFVTGGGWFDSPAGACVNDPAAQGRAAFGFVSRYQKGATIPTGETEFQFKAANMDFHSTAYDWLVICGARAQYKGTGTIGGAGSYGFMLTATDGDQLGTAGPDRLRIKIWDTASGLVVYDNQFGASDTSAATTAIGGGSIVIHSQSGGKGSSIASMQQPVADGEPVQRFALRPARPDPFTGSTSIRFDLPQPAYVHLAVFDLAGRRIARLADGPFVAGAFGIAWNGIGDAGAAVAPGVYMVRIECAREDGRRDTAVRRIVRIH